MISELFIYIDNGNSVDIAGKLERFDRAISFRYSPKWIASGRSFSLDPIQLPVNEGRYTSSRIGKGPLAVFRDSLPDQWGAKVVRQNHPEINVEDPFELLQITSTGDRFGLFEYSASKDLFITGTRSTFPLQDLYEAANSVESNASFDRSLSKMLNLGSSPGGARPKSFFYDDRGEWLAKFPSRFDDQNQAQVEAASLRLLERSGVKVPNFEIIKTSNSKANGDILLVERFDRTPQRQHVISAATLLSGLSDSYIDFAGQIRVVAADPKRELRDLFQRMGFNISIGNRDDHPRNHAMIYGRGGYALSPAFDVVIGEGNRRGQAMATSRSGMRSSLDDAIQSASYFMMDEQDAREIVERVLDTIAGNWSEVMEEFEIGCDDLMWALTR